ncbi:MAG: S46 family peptidase [Simkaniaceae bacterium]|nr:MAG: S46 family peptidase [Simkaniaceae bacterium]
MKPISFIFSLFFLTLALFADEGMWPLNSLPKQRIQEKYGMLLDDDWIEHVQKSCLRVSIGGSASFVSPHGLIMTNHHVASKAIFDLSSEECDLMKEGFYASTNDKELRCPNLYVDQLMVIQDVTEEIASHLSSEMTTMEKEKARKEAIAGIKEQAQSKTGLQPEVITLYRGARHHLYLYKRYSDVRLVMCPEEAVANFGGDSDNFEFPRYCLDMTFFRVYENDQPLQSKHYLKWSQGGPKLGEALFVLGHPGGTDRILTADHLSFYRDISYPLVLQYIEERMACPEMFGETSEENKRIAAQNEMVFSNNRKVYRGLIKGLNGASIIPTKTEFEAGFFSQLSTKEQEPWANMKLALDDAKTYYTDYLFLEGIGSRFSKMYSLAKHLVRIVEEQEKPNGKRLKEYTESELPTLRLAILTTEPVYLNYEKTLLIDGLRRFKKTLGEDHPAVQAAFGKKSVEEVVDEIMTHTQLHDHDYRAKLYQNKEAVENSNDPLIQLVRAIEPYARVVRSKIDDNFLAIQTDSYAEITHLLFEKQEQTFYPDATFTLRLSVGSMIGYDDVDPMTVLEGLFDRAKKHSHEFPYSLPERWTAQRETLNLKTPYNFVSTNDIIGGNSGSPIINAQGEIVGLIFDGNAYTFTWDFAFDQKQGRAVSVHSEGIRHVLKQVYHAEDLLNEITP